MDIVIASLYLPYPNVPHGGGQDLMALIRFLGQRHTLRVVSFVDRAQAAHAAELQPHVAALRLVCPSIGWRAQARSAWAAARRGVWRTFGRRAEAELRQALRDWLAPGCVLLAEWTQMGHYLQAAPAGVVRVLDEVDVRFLAEQAATRTAAARWQAGRRRLAELRYCAQADLVLARSARDLNVLRGAVPRLRGLVLPPVAHAQWRLATDAESPAPTTVLFVGALDRERNQQAAEWLVTAIWPTVRMLEPRAQLRLVGANPGVRVQRLAGQPGVTVTGWVQDLRAEYARARVVVAPMRSEAGALNKVIDGLAAGRPVVATPQANAGVEAPPGAITLANDAPGLAHAIVRLLQDENTWQQQAAAARAFAQRFDWPAAAARVEAELIELASQFTRSQ